MKFLKKYYPIALILLVAGIFFYDYLFIQDFKNNYKKNGDYTVGKVKEVEPYGRGTGYNYIYRFKVNNKEYKGTCDAGNLSLSDAKKIINKDFLVIYLKNNIHNNKLYLLVPVNDSIQSNLQLKQWVDNSPEIKAELDSIPPSGFFLKNYF
ncbi:hypothetical protein J2810_002593 [Chryseobacterium rhizosphaerae]|uniref:hypothetical protein n=1 Tax=Chryseobacterium rhizosphaerae TaxID=395937 RepID=UPI00285B35D4|nr:hypothetical protein [Chryseobacterium rhizosphaerae]MDR6546534.1 hypothetical protein [Chryseobacterium rhizosphaerae]